MKSSHYYRLLVFALSLSCTPLWAAGFGDIPASLALPAGTSVRRNAGNTLFESYTPSTGTVTSIGLLGTSNQITVTGSTPITTSGSWTLSVPSAAQLSIAKLTNLTTNGFVTTSGGNGTLGIDTNTYLTGNQLINVTGDVTGSGTTVIDTTIRYPINVGDIGFTTDGATLVITTGIKGYFTTPYPGTITGWSITATGSSPTCTIDVWKIATGTALPTVANTITASAKPALSTGNAKRSSTLSGWTTSFSAGDIFGFNIDAVTTATKITFVLETTK